MHIALNQFGVWDICTHRPSETASSFMGQCLLYAWSSGDNADDTRALASCTCRRLMHKGDTAPPGCAYLAGCVCMACGPPALRSPGLGSPLATAGLARERARSPCLEAREVST